MVKRQKAVEFEALVRVKCGGCGEAYELDASRLPERHRCGTCGGWIAVPTPQLVVAQVTNVGLVPVEAALERGASVQGIMEPIRKRLKVKGPAK